MVAVLIITLNIQDQSMDILESSDALSFLGYFFGASGLGLGSAYLRGTASSSSGIRSGISSYTRF